MKNHTIPNEKDSFFIHPTQLSSFNIQGENFNYSQVNSHQTENLEEARFNLATRIMSNGVEVIIAGDKSKSIDKSLENSQSMSSTYKSEIQIAPHQTKKPMTLAPSTLKNQMILLVPNNLKDNITIPINTNHFVTKTCLTTYTYRTTYLQDGKTTVESREKVIANIATEERNYPKINSSPYMGVTLTRTPQLAVGVFPTTYSYYFALNDGESSKVVTSEHTVFNTITAPDDYILFLQPSEAATPVFDTNTYLNKIIISKTLDEGGVMKVVSNSETLTQVIVTESLPPRSTSVLTSYYAFDTDETLNQAFPTDKIPQSKNPLYTEAPTKASVDNEVRIYATKTFLTTFTYLTTTKIFQSSTKQSVSILPSTYKQVRPIFTTSVNYYTEIVENIITESIPATLIKPELLSKFRKEFKRGKNQRSVIVTLATLLGGQTLEITAMKMVNPKTAMDQALLSTKIAYSNSYSTETENLHSTESTTLAKISDMAALEKDSYYESSELKPAIIKIKPDKANKSPSKVKLGTENRPQLSTNMSSIFSSFNLNGLTVLRPVLSAMADLLQSKFVSNTNATEIKNNFKNIASDSKPESNNDNPIYIPVQNSLTQPKKVYKFENTEGTQISEGSDFDNFQLAPPQSLHIQPPKAEFAITEESWMHGNLNSAYDIVRVSNNWHNLNQMPLINGGIPIRPGEIITANSDVIVGKPNGIQQPKVYTLQSNLIPLQYDNTQEGSSVPTYEKTKHRQSSLHQPFSPPQNFKYTTLRSVDNYDNILKPPPLPSVPISNQMHPRPPLISSFTSLPPIHPFNFESTISNAMDPSLNKGIQYKFIPKIQNLNNELKNNEIIEIKRMPEIFSTDILPETKNTEPINIFLNNQLNGFKAQNQETHTNSSPNNFFLNSKANKFGYRENIHESLKSTPHKQNYWPHSNHHRINLQTNVLNHDIAINVPPLTFKKEQEVATPVLHGIPPNSGHLIMPHIKIPANELEVQVNLTPHHSMSQSQFLLNYSQNIEKKSALTDFKIQSSYVPTKPLSNSYDRSEFSYQYPKTQQSNRNIYSDSVHKDFTTQSSHIHSNQNRHSELSTFKDAGEALKPAVILESNNKKIQQEANENMEWSREETNLRNSLKTSDQMGAFSSLKNQLFTPQQFNSLTNLSTSTQDQSKRSSHPLLSPLSALQVNNWDEATFANGNSSHLQQTKSKPNSYFLGKSDLQNITTSQMKQLNKTTTLEPILYAKTTSLPSNSTYKDNNWKTDFASISNTQSISGLQTSYMNTNKNITSFPLSHGQPFTQHSIPNKKKIPLQNQGIHERINNNLFIAKGEGFKFNDQPLFSSKKPSDNTNIKIYFDHSTHTLSPVSSKTKFTALNTFSASNIDLFHWEQANNIHSQNFLSTKQTSKAKAHLSIGTAYYSNLNLPELKISSTTHTPMRSILYETIASTFTKTLPSLLKSSQPFSKLSFGDSLSPKSNSYPQIRKHATPEGKESIHNTQLTTSSRFALSSRVQFSNSLIQTKDGIKHTTALLPKPSQTTHSYSAVFSDSKQLWNPHKSINGSEMDKYFLISSESPEIVLQPSMDFSTPILTLSNEYLPSTILKSLSASNFSTILKDEIKSQNYEKSNLSLKQFVQFTKFITNTVTTTKTSISTKTIKNEREETQNNFKTTTFKLTTTLTSTVVDTVTETHTLIQPTRTASSHNIFNSLTLNTSSDTANELMVTFDKSSYSIRPETELTLFSQANEKAGVNLEYDFTKLSKNQSEAQKKQTEKFHTLSPVDKDNIFIVMTNRQGSHNIKTTVDTTFPSLNEDYSERVNVDLASRDEELFFGSEERINNILLGGVLLATTNSSSTFYTQPQENKSMTQCQPGCKTSRNEICKESGLNYRCVCRPGFARMFPDRPCKPTYTYTMQIVIRRISDFLLVYNSSLSDNTTSDFRELATITHDAIDRMVMQSDFRDVYHGVSIEFFGTDNTRQAVVANAILQFSDINDEKRLEDVFKKYLRINGYNIGLTELYTDKNGAQMITVSDYNECSNSNLNDCSTNAQCFNLKGTYTCSCNDGYTDLSENLVFPGRLCSAEIIGCEKCNFHGQCLSKSKTIGKEELIVCECFAWYSGAQCQLNLKILLIALMAFGTILFIVLLICIFLTCVKHREPRKLSLASIFTAAHDTGKTQSSFLGVEVKNTDGYKAMGFSKKPKPDKCAMIMDTSSESSDNSLPYLLKDSIRNETKNANNKTAAYSKNDKDASVRVIKENFKHTSFKNHSKVNDPNIYIRTGSKTMLPTFEPLQNTILTEIEQSDRSLTVMIPRAKYHPSVLPQAKLLHHQLTLERTNTAASQYNESQTESVIKEKHTTLRADNSSSGELVSSGFEVSAIVNERTLCSNHQNPKTNLFTNDCIPELCITAITTSDDSRHNNDNFYQYEMEKVSELDVNKGNECHILNYNIYKSEDSHETTDEWLDRIQQTSSSAEGHPFSESMTLLNKCIRNENDLQTINTNEEANTMAERDIGSTFLLPHTHLYKPERESDVSLLDSM